MKGEKSDSLSKNVLGVAVLLLVISKLFKMLLPKKEYISPFDLDFAKEERIRMGGKTYADSIKFYCSEEGSGIGAVYYNVEKYDSVSGVFGIEDKESDEDFEANIAFQGDGKLLKKIRVEHGEIPKRFKINLRGKSQLSVFALHSGKGNCGLGEVGFRRKCF